MSTNTKPGVRLVAHTTRYREGSPEFARIARTLRDDLARDGAEVWLVALDGKKDFVEAMRSITHHGRSLEALHFVGHSGMYGPMFGSTDWPEQLSPHEWKHLEIPFTETSTAHFHACRTARWFTPFFARTFGVRTFGHHGYTTFSRAPDRFVWEGPLPDETAPLYAIACPGRKTHGLSASMRKYTVGAPAVPMREVTPAEVEGHGSYDPVADLYDAAFEDITLRRREWAYVTSHIDAAFGARRPRVLDIGCGNGALLGALSGRIGESAGVDVSAGMIAHACRRNAAHAHLAFTRIEGPSLPFADGTFDVVVSFLSFRYLDWDPILAEIRRVLAPGGRLLVVDMVEKPLALTLTDARLLVSSAIDHFARPIVAPSFDDALRRLTRAPAWATMLEHNPIRAEHEYRWFFESRFPQQRLETLTVTRTQRLVAFDTGPIGHAPFPTLEYP